MSAQSDSPGKSGDRKNASPESRHESNDSPESKTAQRLFESVRSNPPGALDGRARESAVLGDTRSDAAVQRPGEFAQPLQQAAYFDSWNNRLQRIGATERSIGPIERPAAPDSVIDGVHINDRVANAFTVRRGEGPYQSVERMFGQALTHEERMQFCNVLKEQYAEDIKHDPHNSDRAPDMSDMRVGYKLLRDDNIGGVINKMQKGNPELLKKLVVAGLNGSGASEVPQQPERPPQPERPQYPQPGADTTGSGAPRPAPGGSDRAPATVPGEPTVSWPAGWPHPAAPERRPPGDAAVVPPEQQRPRESPYVPAGSDQTRRSVVTDQAVVNVSSQFDPNKPMHVLVYYHGFDSSFTTGYQKARLDEQMRAAPPNTVLIAPRWQDREGSRSSSREQFEEQGGLRAALKNVLPRIGRSSLRQGDAIDIVAYSAGYNPAGDTLRDRALSPLVSSVTLLDSPPPSGLNSWLAANRDAILQGRKRFVDVAGDWQAGNSRAQQEYLRNGLHIAQSPAVMFRRAHESHADIPAAWFGQAVFWPVQQ